MYLTTLGRKRGRTSRTDGDPVANLACSVLKQEGTRRKRHRKGCAKRRRKERLQKYDCEDGQYASAESWEEDTNSDNEWFAEHGSGPDGDSEIKEWQNNHEEQPPNIWHNSATGEVRLNDENGEVLGRVNTLKSNLSVSIYCRKHGCRIMRAPAKLPSNAAMEQWYLDGLDIAPGKAGRQKHTTMFKDIPYDS